jgi:glycosyltransferase involved in cell wall biosynthesis
MATVPRVIIGMPVYNGSDYVAEAIESFLKQTFENFELIISDNASTDDTEDICRSYAGRDRRIRYSRLDTNVGAARNFNRVFDDCRSDYFKWAAHDDLCLPTFLERCVETLDGAPQNVALCMPKTIFIDDAGKVLHDHDDRLDLRMEGVTRRMSTFATRILASGCHSVFGLIRTPALRNTRLIGPFVCSDVVLLGELATQGPLWEIPDRLFCSRIHPGCSHQKFRSKDNGLAAYAEWFDPANRGRPIRLMRAKLVLEQLRGIGRAGLSPWTKLACGCGFTTAWCFREGRVELGALRRHVRRRLAGMARTAAPRSAEEPCPQGGNE